MKRSQLQGMLLAKCPHCRHGNMFKYPFWKLKKFDQMYTFCPHCGQRYESEPGFFIGATYVSYALSVGIVLATAIVLYNFFGDPSAFAYIGVSIGLMLALMPFNFRISRVIYIYLFSGIEYEEKPRIIPREKEV
ncbi:DUF983 domain-containing protein [Siphonobacter sp. SORGH_AS_1065]|uniref:DUF983 domain-containing protein n=1 Tax=Siphonobacter sp. SORGH_AS_1065 TaxID=3041795 RepID=UPI0027860690|nr:DUF983 domain-containing protein [Siphonobacter sp. SORGH_AS_1065]MDQ1090578.1 uncharacterized protein (DUF983 family) [Siphonobacter sp. SORGH_AS_1065]